MVPDPLSNQDTKINEQVADLVKLKLRQKALIQTKQAKMHHV